MKISSGYIASGYEDLTLDIETQQRLATITSRYFDRNHNSTVESMILFFLERKIPNKKRTGKVIDQV